MTTPVVLFPTILCGRKTLAKYLVDSVLMILFRMSMYTNFHLILTVLGVFVQRMHVFMNYLHFL